MKILLIIIVIYISNFIGGAEDRVVLTKASWYGQAFHNKQTANGQIFDENKLTCATTKYKFGTILRVRNIENGLYVDVVCNDRGPFEKNKEGKFVKHSKREIDLSKAAFLRISKTENGVINCTIQVIKNNRWNFQSIKKKK